MLPGSDALSLGKFLKFYLQVSVSLMLLGGLTALVYKFPIRLLLRFCLIVDIVGILHVSLFSDFLG